MRLLKIVFAVVIMYLYIYSPALQILSFGLDKIIFVLSIGFILFNKDCLKYLALFKRDYRLLSVILLFSLLNILIHFGEYGSGLLMYDFFLLIEPIPVACSLYMLMELKWKVEIREVIYITAGVAGLITVLLLLNPSMLAYVKNSVLRVPEVLTTYFSFRGIGLADGLLNPYPTAQGLILGLLLCGFFKQKIYYYVLAIPIFVSIIVNARTGVVPVILGLILLLIFGVNYTKKKNLVGGIIVMSAVLLIVINKVTLSTEAEESLEWGKTTLDIMEGLIKGEDVDNVEALTQTMVFYPETIGGWLFGGGYSVYSGNTVIGKSSDIGYIIRLHYGGIIYLLILVGVIIGMCKRLYKINKPIAILMFLSFLIFNYKTDFFIMSPCSRLFFLVYVILVCSQYDSQKSLNVNINYSN